LTAATNPSTPSGASNHEGTAGGSAAGGPRGGSRLGRLARIPGLGVLPFVIYTILFLFVPMVVVLIGAFQSPSGGFTLHNIHLATQHSYGTGFINSIKLAAFTSIVPGILGTIIAYAVHMSPRGNILRRMVATASGVLANFGGVPLAFLFIATVGSAALVTGWLSDLGWNPYNHGFSLYSLTGVGVVYMYFQIPLMVVVITPALAGLRPAWREAADNLGARSWQFWRYVGIPVLAPAVFGSILLLFGSGLAAYATADALTSGSIALTPIEIGSFLNGNVIAGQQNVGKALSLGLVLIIAVAIALYAVLQRRVSRWLR
jgi:putative spermidine/putrescine transport system permease protein